MRREHPSSTSRLVAKGGLKMTTLADMAKERGQVEPKVALRCDPKVEPKPKPSEKPK